MTWLIVSMAVLVETLIEYYKDLRENDFPVERFIALVLGIFFAFGASLCVFDLADVSFRIGGVGTVIMGIFLSRGSEWIHDFLDSKTHRKAA